MASGMIRVPRTTGLPDTFPGTHSISSHCVQSISEVMSALVMVSIPQNTSISQDSRRTLPPAGLQSGYVAHETCSVFSTDSNGLRANEGVHRDSGRHRSQSLGRVLSRPPGPETDQHQ